LAAHLLSFADGRLVDIDAKMDFVFTILRDAKFDHYNELAASLVHAFVVPIFSIINDTDRLQSMCVVLSHLSQFIVNHLPFTSVLRLLITELADFPLGSADSIRAVILRIIRDYDYDTQTTVSLTYLCRQNELDANREYAAAAVPGTRRNDPVCSACGARIAGTDLDVRVFRCEHVFHEQRIALQVCPRCRAGAVDADGNPPVPKVNERDTGRRFRRFEARLKSGFGQEKPQREKKASITVARPK
jgi:hypothetical protein